MEFKDTIQRPTTGILSVVATDLQGNVLYSFNDANMIMTATKETLAHLIGGDVAGKSVTHVVLGNDDTTPSPDNFSIGGINTESLASGQNLATGGVLCAYLKTVTGHTYPVAGRITFNWVLDYGEANGLAIKEYGLVCSDLTLFARKTRGTVTKDSGMHIAGAWTIIF